MRVIQNSILRCDKIAFTRFGRTDFSAYADIGGSCRSKVPQNFGEAIYREADHSEDTRIEEKRLHTGQEYKILHTMNNIHKNSINIH